MFEKKSELFSRGCFSRGNYKGKRIFPPSCPLASLSSEDRVGIWLCAWMEIFLCEFSGVVKGRHIEGCGDIEEKKIIKKIL